MGAILSPRLATIFPASKLSVAPADAPRWTVADLAGRLVEISAGTAAAPLTAAFGLVLDTQLGGDRAAWVTLTDSTFYPPDVLDVGVDLDALPIVRVLDARMAGRAADHLVRSGGFGLVVVDLSTAREAGAPARADLVPVPLLTRLLGLARQHDVAVLLLTKKSSGTPSLHSLISLRAEACRCRSGDGRFEVSIRVLKDKRGGLLRRGWTHVEMCRGPAGLR
jgi:recombination protein RecA